MAIKKSDLYSSFWGYLQGITGLPANLFYGTGIPACILVLDKKNAVARRSLFMIDAFSDVNAEIAALEQRRDKTRTLKQGMMQELLTGKTNLL
jgi:type I restriction-modification system DNA methylase subunit